MIFEEIKSGRKKPVELIFGTDWWTDCDDVAALDLLLKAHRSGLIDLKAIGVSSVMRYSAPSVRAVCEGQGLGCIPIGLDTSAERRGLFCLYQKKLAAFCRTGFTNADCPEAYQLYRRVLASVHEKAVIVDVGFPQIITELLSSGPDEYSSLDGARLVAEKVAEVVVMGGRWDKTTGREYNFCAYKRNREAAAYLCDRSPVPLTFLGYEAGRTVVTGGSAAPGLTGTAYAAHLSPKGRPSRDPMTALFAVVGDAAKAGYRRVRGAASVDPKTGKNSFTVREDGPHSYLVKEKKTGFIKNRSMKSFGWIRCFSRFLQRDGMPARSHRLCRSRTAPH
ncbi:MAG: hypothetical protein IJL26_08685 [Clostridia bacterium]|nr:hypothetical protein [Clostridia bacterium]